MAERWLGRTRGIASLALVLLRVPLWLCHRPSSPKARQHERAAFATIARGFGIRIETSGSPSALPGTLFIMNHISWADVPVAMAILDADFVAKSDVAGWPVIGALARRFGPVFVARGQRQRSHDQADAIRSRLRAGRSVILCPEGTTSDGASILPFRTSLFAAADAASTLQPIILRYLDPDGSAPASARMRELAWIDDDSLLPGAMRVACKPSLALLEFLPPVTGTSDRKSLAQVVRQQMLDAYAAAPNRPR
ncbi:MAG: hypothetical protein RL367_2539 [Pseudomonadota bacterium]